MKLTILKPRVQTIPGRLPTLGSSGWRTSDMSAAERGYDHRWRKARDRYLRLHPLCVMCGQETPSRTVVATVVDHKIPHRGDKTLFWDETNWQSLCAPHHSSHKQRMENEAAKA